MFDPSLIKPQDEKISRTFGHTKVGFAKKVDIRRVIQDNPDYRPNRLDRRRWAAEARAVPVKPKNPSKAQLARWLTQVGEKHRMQALIKTNKMSYVLAHTPHRNAVSQYFPEDYEYTEEDERKVRNALKRRRKTLGW